MGETVKKGGYRDKIELLNRKKQLFDWNNDEIEYDESLIDDYMMHS